MSTGMKSLNLAVVGILALSISLLNHVSSAKASIKSEVLTSRPNVLLPAQERVYSLDEKSFPDVIQVVEVKNLQAEDFPLSMEIIVKNLSAKNIYGVTMGILFPDSRVEGKAVGSNVYYGDKRLMRYDNRPNPGESFIAPGKTGIVKLEQDRAFAFVKAIEKEKLPLAATYNLEISFQTLNFGDGTGYGGKQLYPLKTSQLQKGLNRTQRSLVNKALRGNPGRLGFGKSFTWSNNIRDQELEDTPVRGVIDGILNFPLSDFLKEPAKPSAFCNTYFPEPRICTYAFGCGPGDYCTVIFFSWASGGFILDYVSVPTPCWGYNWFTGGCDIFWCYEDKPMWCLPY